MTPDDHGQSESQPHKTRITTANLPGDLHRQLVEDMREFFPEAEVRGPVIQRSQVPPAWVEIAASLATWQNVFLVAATAFLTAYGKKAGETVAQKTPTLLRGFVTLLRKLAAQLDRPLSVIIQVPGPGSQFTRISLSLDDQMQATRDLALFVAHLPAIEVALKTLPAHDLGSEVYCEVGDDSFALSWLSYSENRKYTRTFDSTGKAT